MDIFSNVIKTRLTNAHGEVNFFKIEEGSLPQEGWDEYTDMSKGGNIIVGHSESGSVHVLEREGVNIHKAESNGFTVLRAIVKKPVKLKQEAGAPHAPQIVEPGDYIITNAIEKPFFQEQARRVAD